MDINSLFSQPDSTKKTEINTSPNHISVFNTLSAQPLVYGLEQKNIDHRFIIQKDTPAVCSQKLIEKNINFGLLPTIDYEQGKGSWKIIPNLCIAARGPVKSVNLFFNKDMRGIKTIAIDNNSRSSYFLLKVLMQERYQIEPDYILMAPDLELMLKSADAALITGDLGLHYRAENNSCLDLGEEWFDFTGLPFVFAFWAGIENVLKPSDVQNIMKSSEIGRKSLDKIAAEYAINGSLSSDVYSNYLTKNICYDFGPEQRQGLEEFYRYCFYLSFIDHIPEVHSYEI